MNLRRINSSLLLPALLTSGALLATVGSAQATVFQAEDYNNYFDTTAGNTGGAYRSDDVDIEATTDTGGGYNLAYVEQTEWLVYNNLNVPTAGNYKIRLRVASAVGGAASIDLNGGALVLGTATIPNTGDWQNWQTVEITANLPAGTHSLGIYAQTSDWNLNWIEVIADGEDGGSATGAVVVSQHCNYDGWTAGLDEGSYNLAALLAKGVVDDDASSLTVQSGYEAILFKDDNFTGESVTITGNDDCLVNEGFNDTVTSIIVRQSSGNNDLTWSDEFDNINLSTWTFETGGGGWGNSELQYYTGGQNAFIEYDGAAGSNVLVIEARQENPAGYGCWYGSCSYTSTRLISRDKQSFKYGRVEARLKLPQTQGIWPAFWMMGDALASQGWPQGGEIDIMEHVGFEPTLTHGALHGPGYSGNTPILGTADVGQSVDAAYHIYAIEWNTDEIRWFVDGNNFYTATRAQIQQYGEWVYDQPFWLLLNVAVGGSWPGSPDGSSTFPQRMSVDYIRVYQ